MSGIKKIKVHANSSQEKIEENEDEIELWIKEKPIDGKANSAIEKKLTKHFKKKVKIISGFKSKFKKVQIKDD